MKNNIRNNKSYAPSITVVMISYNDQNIINDCLHSIRKQDYNQELIKIIMVDGGSVDDTLNIAEKYNVDFQSRPDLKESPNIRGGIALTSAETDLVLFISADNRLQESDVLSSMVNTLSDPSIVACETLRYGFQKSDPIMSRYFALIGGADPIAVGLGKADRGPHDTNKWHGMGEVQDCQYFYKITFSNDTSKIPTLGANGFLFRRDLLKKAKLVNNAYHIDMCVELILQGHNKFAFLKNKHVIHYLDIGIFRFLKRRLLYANMYDGKDEKRIYSVFHKKDILKLTLLIIFNITLLIPFSRAIKGFIHKNDIAWFLHPLVSFVFTVGYSIFFIKKQFKK